MQPLTSNQPPIDLTSTEVANIWSAFLKNSMELRFFEYFFATAEDSQVQTVVKKMLNHAQDNLKKLESLFIAEKLEVPVGFTDKDVFIGTQKVFSDSYILFFVHDLTLLSLSSYPSAISDITRKDVRALFQGFIDFTVMIQNEMTELMLVKGIYLRPPQLAIASELVVVDSMKYLNGFLGEPRPLNMPEIANLTRILYRAQFSKMVFVTFHHLATTKDLKQHFKKGRDEIEKVLDSLQEVLENENIPIAASGDYKIMEIGFSPFSEKLMLFFVNSCLGMFCFTMVNQALITCLRSDIVYKLMKISRDMRKYYGKGLLLTISNQWLEEPPKAANNKL